MLLLVVSILALAVGPALARLSASGRAVRSALDGFVMVTVGGLVLLHILPESLAEGGAAAAIAATVGFASPLLWDRLFSRGARGIRSGLAALAAVGLAIHAGLDGVAIGFVDGRAGDVHGDQLAVGIAIHRLPIGLIVWWTLRARLGDAAGWLGVAGLGAATVAGFFAGAPLLDALEGPAVAVFMAVVAAALLHVVLHDVQHHVPRGPADGAPEPAATSKTSIPAAIGALGGALALWLLGHEDPHAAAVDQLAAGPAFVALVTEIAPALLVAYLGVAALRATPARSIRWPLPTCGADARAVGESLLRAGSPGRLTTAYLAVAPAIGFDAICISIPLLGAGLTASRAAAAVVAGLAAALLLGRQLGPRRRESRWSAHREGRPMHRSMAALAEVTDHALPWLAVGLLTAAFLEPVLGNHLFASAPRVLVVPIAAVLGAPLYVCAAAATPVLAVLMHKGLSAGAAVAFLVTGPAIGLTASRILARSDGTRIAGAFFAAIVGVACAAGWLTDILFPAAATALDLHAAAARPASAWQWAALAVLAAFFFASLVRNGPRGMVGEVASTIRTRTGKV